MFAAFLLVFAFPGTAESNRVAEVNVGAYGVSWLPQVSYGKITLTVSRPDGTVFRKVFEAGSTPYFDLSQNKGNSGDGTYNFELVVTPFSKQVRKEGDTSVSFGAEGSSVQSREALVQSGAFRVHHGTIVTGGSMEAKNPPAYNSLGGSPESPDDQVFLDDLIVDGSACIGFDCVNGESFGFDTLRLKENNLRVHFDDTSSSASFPSNDWRIVINDSANGGASYFGIEDSTAGRRTFSIEAGAPTHSLYVDDGGRVGFGTSTPVVDLHAVSGNTPTLRLEQNGSSGFAPQSWDAAGNETNFFIRDVTNGSTLPFRIQPGAPSSVLTLRADNKVGVGTWAPTYDLHVSRSTTATFGIENTGGAAAKISAGSNAAQFGSATNDKVHFVVNNSTKVLTIDTDSQVGIGQTNPTHLLELSGGAFSDGSTWTDASSREYKKDIENLEAAEAIDTLEALTPVKFKYKRDESDGHVGFIAEDVPDLVATKNRKGMSPMDVVAVLTRVVKEQQKTITDLNKKVNELVKKSQSDK